MATFALQALGCDVAAINTVNFSNHTGYRQFKGRRTPASEIRELYEGLRKSYLTDFEMLVSGYAPSAEVVEAVGFIARDLRYRSTVKPGGFFWILDPVMGDQGRLYVAEEIVPAYKQLVREADLILPNQFEAELLSGVSISSLSGVANAVRTMHTSFGTRHIIVTSIQVGEDNGDHLTVVGSTKKADGTARLFKIEVPKLDCFFSGTGDMLAGLMAARLREASAHADLLSRASWAPDDDVEAVDLPLAKATEKVLSSMQIVLEKTLAARDAEMKAFGASPGASVGGVEGEDGGDSESQRRYLAETKAAEVRVVRHARDLQDPQNRYKAEALEV
ncbi:pyridoxine kinase [Exophiala aquamarina CBS 119918]|uniref:pyridoxal kinase n=1 Tax=Exophiala aquamarina CBS 119918 TaxID=1182545 RepID=A0A072P5L7_9EURO|nr:pyridoxine kinase [Exophiala aquamarina CBS 119918]KEF55017.1 pyridoxine kinase [Exophiala aquamarina CBS 119918]